MRYEKDNLSFLQQNLRYLGFGETLPFNDQLAEELGKDIPEFQLKTEVHFDEWSKVVATLYFRKAGQQDAFFLTKYTAEVQYLENADMNRMQTFYVFKGVGVTLKESFNLLQERAVYKELTGGDGEKYHAWIQLDFKQKEENGNYKTKQFHENYGYNLMETLQKFPIRELMDEQKSERLTMSLQKGNLQSVTLNVEGKEQMFFMQANPQYKTVTMYDNGATRPLSNEQKVELMTPEARQKLNGKDISTEPEQQGKEIKKDDKAKKNEQKEDESLLPKKRKSENKGLAIS